MDNITQSQGDGRGRRDANGRAGKEADFVVIVLQRSALKDAGGASDQAQVTDSD